MTDTDNRRYKRILQNIAMRIDYAKHTSAVHHFKIRDTPPWDEEDKKKLPQYMQFALEEIYRWELRKIDCTIIYPLYNIFDGRLYAYFNEYPTVLQEILKAYPSYNNMFRVPMFSYRFANGMESPYTEEQIKEGKLE